MKSIKISQPNIVAAISNYFTSRRISLVDVIRLSPVIVQRAAALGVSSRKGKTYLVFEEEWSRSFVRVYDTSQLNELPVINLDESVNTKGYFPWYSITFYFCLLTVTIGAYVFAVTHGVINGTEFLFNNYLFPTSMLAMVTLVNAFLPWNGNATVVHNLRVFETVVAVFLSIFDLLKTLL